MKHTILGITLAGITIMVTVVCMIINGRTVRQNEINKSFDTAIEQTVDELNESHTYSLDNKQEFLADFVQGLLLKIKSDGEVEVKVAGADAEKGLLSIKVIVHYKHPNGKPGTVEAERTVILENYSLEKEKTFTITYKVNDVDYKVYTLIQGSRLPMPKNPEGSFVCWLDESGQAVNINTLLADSDKVFKAQME